MSFKKEYFVKRPIGNGYYVYKRDGEYNIQTKNTKSLKETYMGKLLDIENGAFIYINSKAVKQGSLHSFLSDNKNVYFGLLEKCRKYYNWEDKGNIQKLGAFLLKQEVTFYEDAVVQKLENSILRIEGFFIDFKSVNKYRLQYHKNQIVSLEINPVANTQKREIKILEYINPNIKLNIKTGKLKNFIIIHNSEENEIKTKHSGSVLRLDKDKKYLYSDLELSLDDIALLIKEYKLITRIIINIENLLASIGRERFDQEYHDKMLYLIKTSYYINHYFIAHSDKNTIREIQNNPFPAVN